MKGTLSIYSEDMHDYYFLAVLEIFLESGNYQHINILSHKKKFKRIEKNEKQLDKNGILINHSNLKSPNASILKMLYRIRLNKLYTITIRLINTIKLLYWLFIQKNRKNDLFITELQDKINPSLISLAMQKRNDNQLRFLTLHNVNRFFKENTTLNTIFQKFNNIIVLSEHLKRKVSDLYSDKNILVFPAAVPSVEILNMRQEYLKYIKTDVIQFSVTGSVDDKRKDYKSIINLFKYLDQSSYKIVFLGKLVSEWVKDYANHNSINAVFYEDFVTDTEFSKQIISSHFLITMNNSENYYTEKISGIMYDAIRYGLPLISNNHTFEHPNLKNILVDQLDDLKDILISSQKNYFDLFGKKSLELSLEALPKNIIKSLGKLHNGLRWGNYK